MQTYEGARTIDVLDTAAFEAWWRALPIDDYDAFIYYGGDEVLMRFVCAFDELSRADGRATPSRIVQAYALAIGEPPAASGEIVIRAGKAWEHPAVRELLDRVKMHDLISAKTRIARRYTALLERVLTRVEKEDTSMGDLATAASTVGSYLKIVQQDELDLRRLRAKQAAKVRAVIEQSAHQPDVPKEEELPAFLRMLSTQFGPEKLKELVAGVTP